MTWKIIILGKQFLFMILAKTGDIYINKGFYQTWVKWLIKKRRKNIFSYSRSI